jgi:hypothetical protein
VTTGRLLLEDLIANYGTVSAGSQNASTPAGNLKDPQLAFKWRTSAGTNSTHILADLGAIRSLDVVALVSTNLTAAATWRIRLSTTDSSGTSGNAHDSGSRPANADPLYNGTAIYFLPAPANGRYLRVDLTDTSLAFLEAGRLIAGACWRLTYNYRFGWSMAAADDAAVLTTWGGADWRDARPTRRRLRAELLMTKAEYQQQGQALMRAVGADILFVLDPDSANLSRDSVFGRLAPVELRNPYPARYTAVIDVTERLP